MKPIYKNDGTIISSFKPYQRITRFSLPVQTLSINAQNYNAVNINTYEVQTYDTDYGVLYLPTTYAQYGTPTKLIIFCKAGGTKITATNDPIMSLNIFQYMLKLGYAIFGMDGTPDTWATNLLIDDGYVNGNYIAVESTINGYNYIIENYNIDRNGCYIFGYSQGGWYANNVINNSHIPIIASAELSPMVSLRYQSWDNVAPTTIDGKLWDKSNRYRLSRVFGYSLPLNNEELNSFVYDNDKFAGYDAYFRNSENPYMGFVQGNQYRQDAYKLPDDTTIESITMKTFFKCPLKIWAAVDDAVLGVDVTRVFAKSIRNNGGICDMVLLSSGGHSIQTNQTRIGTFVENNITCNLYPLAYNIASWFYQWGGYKPNI